MALVERERKYLVATMPDLTDPGVAIRQGYLVAENEVAVRIRESDGRSHRFTVKGGKGAVRTEVEWDITADEFGALWPLTDGRRIEKVRHLIPVDHHTAELDVFSGDLAGLVVVEVEFDSEESMEAFEPPDWFGDDVTDRPGYSNAALALHGRPEG